MCIAQLVEYIQYHPSKSVEPENLHTIGYSVGAHMLGLVSNHLAKGRLGRITGKLITLLAIAFRTFNTPFAPLGVGFVEKLIYMFL